MTRTLTTETIKLWRNNAGITAGETAEDDPEHIAAKAILALTAEILANREAQPVAVVISRGNLAHVTDGELELGTKLYTAPPAPAVPDIKIQKAILWLDGVIQSNPGMKEPVTCRAAMLSHVGETNEKAAAKCECSSIDYCENCLRAMLAQPVSSGYKLPDDWKLVPVEPTEEMLRAAYREAAVYSPTAYRAMLAAAPEGGHDHDTRR